MLFCFLAETKNKTHTSPSPPVSFIKLYVKFRESIVHDGGEGLGERPLRAIQLPITPPPITSLSLYTTTDCPGEIPSVGLDNFTFIISPSCLMTAGILSPSA